MSYRIVSLEVEIRVLKARLKRAEGGCLNIRGTKMILFTTKIILDNETWDTPYRSLDDCLNDPGLAQLLDLEGATCLIWCGGLRLTGKPITSSTELRDAIIDNAGTILRNAPRKAACW